MKYLLLVTFVAFVGGCASTNQNQQLRAITPVDVNSSAQEFDGKKIKLEGYLTLRRDSHVIFQSKDLGLELKAKIDSGDVDLRDYAKFCVTVLVNERLEISNKMRDGVDAVVIGVYEDNYLDGSTVDIGACQTRGALRILDVKER